jgi:LysM repeat protein
MKVKIPKLLMGKVLRAATARRAAGVSAEMDYGEMAEPNMKLSRALLIVLLLHIVAVSGIIAFNAIKTRQSSLAPAASVNTEDSVAPATAGSMVSSDTSNLRSASVQTENGRREEAKTPRSLLKSLAKDEHAQAIYQEKLPTSSGKIYTVVRGDNPVTIARKLKVPYEDLIALNHIEDPRRLQIGQRLLIPKAAKTTKIKKSTK